MSIYPIEIMNLGKPTFDVHYDIINDLNSLQESFKFILPSEEYRSWGAKFEQEPYDTDEIWKLLKDYRENSKGFHPFIIAIVHGSLRSRRLKNIFGNFDKRDNLAVFTTYQWDTLFAPPPLRVFLTYYFINYAMRFICPEITIHEETRDCFFDRKMNKKDIKLSMSSGNLCRPCNQLLEGSIDSNTYDSLFKLIEYMKNNAVVSSQVDLRPVQRGCATHINDSASIRPNLT